MTSPIEGHNETTLTYIGGPWVNARCECGWAAGPYYEADQALEASIDHRCYAGSRLARGES